MGPTLCSTMEMYCGTMTMGISLMNIIVIISKENLIPGYNLSSVPVGRE